MATITFEVGDDLVIMRRRYTTVKDGVTGEDVQSASLEEISSVRAPQQFTLGGRGGSVEPFYIADPEQEGRDRQFLRILIPMRYGRAPG